MDVILASASPRRKELLSGLCPSFVCIPAKGEEKPLKSLPQDVVCELSKQKALDVEQQVRLGDTRKEKEYLIIGSDTIVAYNGKIMGKPANKEEAYYMLSALQNHTHKVYTGVTFLIEQKTRIENTFYEEADVTMYPMTEKQIRDYINTGEPMDKAGAYAIQGKCAVYIKRVEGEYNTVVGFPIARIYQELLKKGIILC